MMSRASFLFRKGKHTKELCGFATTACTATNSWPGTAQANLEGRGCNGNSYKTA